MKDVSELVRAIETMHSCKAIYIGSKAVHEVFNGQTAWEGEVETFDLTGHSQAQRCYAWFYTDDKGENQYTIVLAIPPVNSPENAVKAAIGASARPDKSTVGKALNKVWALVLRSSQTDLYIDQLEELKSAARILRTGDTGAEILNRRLEWIAGMVDLLGIFSIPPQKPKGTEEIIRECEQLFRHFK